MKTTLTLETQYNNNIGLVWMCVNRFTDSGIDRDDLFQTGSMGLLKAIKKYDESKGALSTFAVYYIIGEIKKYVHNYHKILYDNEIVNSLSKDFENLLDNSIYQLTDFEQDYLKHRYYLRFSQDNLAKKYNMSQSKISRIQKQIIEKIKKFY